MYTLITLPVQKYVITQNQKFDIWLSEVVDVASLVLGHLCVKVLLHCLLGLLCELELRPGSPFLGELVHLGIQVLLLHQVGGIPDDTTHK